MLGLFLMAAQAASVAPATVQCTIIAQKSERGQELFGSCEKSAVMLGLAMEFESATHAATGSVVAVVKRGSETHVLLVRPTADGDAFLEDITGDLARQGGQSPDIGLTDLSVDISRFAGDGIISVYSANKGIAAAGKAESAELGAVSAITLVADEEARLAMPPEKPRVVDVAVERLGAGAK